MKIITVALISGLLASPLMAEAVTDTGGPAISSTSDSATPVPEIFSDVPDLHWAGMIAGMQAWTAAGTNMMFLRDPETGGVIAGFPFDDAGVSLHPRLSEEQGAGFADMVREFFGPSIEIPEQYAPSVEERLEALSEEDRQAAIRDLIDHLSGVEGEDAFNSAVEAWLAGISGTEAHQPSEGHDDTVDEPQRIESEETAGAYHAVDGTGSAELEERATDDAGLSLIDAVRRSFTLQVGQRDAPLAYIITDPTCEPCRLANDLLRERVEAGALQLRVVMLSIVDEDSLGTIAGIVGADDPAAAYLAMSLDDGSEMPFARTAGLPQVVTQGLEANYAMAEAFEIPQLPFVIFEGEAGPVYISGAPAPEQLDAALPPGERDRPLEDVAAE